MKETPIDRERKTVHEERAMSQFPCGEMWETV